MQSILLPSTITLCCQQNFFFILPTLWWRQTQVQLINWRSVSVCAATLHRWAVHESKPDYAAAEQNRSLINFKKTVNHGPGRLVPKGHKRKVCAGARISKKSLPEGVSVTCNPLKKIKTISWASSLPDPQLMSVSRVDKQLCMQPLSCCTKITTVFTGLLWQLPFGEKHKKQNQHTKKGIATQHIVSHGGIATTGGGGGSVSRTDDQQQQWPGNHTCSHLARLHRGRSWLLTV